MKTFVKTLLSILLIAAIATGITVAVFAEDETVVERINVTLNALDVSPAPDMANTATKAIIYNAMYDAHNNLTEDMEGYSELKARIMEKELLLLDAAISEYGAAESYSAKYNAVSWIKNVIDYGFTVLTEDTAPDTDTDTDTDSTPVDGETQTVDDTAADTAADSELKATVAAILAEFDELYKEKRAELESYVPVSEYEQEVPGTNIDMEGSIPFKPANLSSNVSHVVSNGFGSKDSNSYYEIIYHTKSNTYVEPNFGNLADNYVIEFDYTTFGKPINYISFTCADECTVCGNACRYSRQWPLLIAFEGFNITNGAAGKGEVLGSIVPGQWTHVSVVIDNVQDTFDIYINYELVEKDRSYAVTGHELNNLKAIRMGSQNDDSRSFAIDGILGYEGTCPRTLDRLSSMETDEERLEFYANTLENENASFTDRYISLNTLAKSISNYCLDGEILPEYAENEQVITFVNTYLNYEETANPENYEFILSGYKEENLKHLKTILERYETAGRKLSNIVARQASLDLADAFLEESMFEETAPGLKAAKDTLAQYKIEIERDNAAYAFMKAMFSFDRSPTVSAKEKHYITAMTSFESFKNDSYNGGSLIDHYLTDTSKYPTTDEGKIFSFYYDLYSGAKDLLDAVVRQDNSNNFIVCISYVSGYTTEEEYEANFTEIKRLIEIAREMVYTDKETDGAYFDADIEGFEAAMAHYERINAYFYNKLQQQHVETLASKLTAVENSDSYIERSGACTYVNNYIAVNDIDMSRSDIQEIIAKCEAFERELGTQLEQYEELLEQNTTYFINVVSKINAASGYSAFRALYDEATEYYYKMNINGEGVGGAIALYEAYREQMNEIESENALFVAAVKSLLNSKKRANQYKYLVECQKHISFAEQDIEGVSAAITTYNQLKASYDKEVNSINGEVLETVNTMCTVRKDYDASQSAVATKDIFE